MTHLQTALRTALAGAAAEGMDDEALREVILTIADDANRELTTPQAAQFLGKSELTLKRWRCQGIGPTYRKDPGGAIRYRMAWLHEFMNEGVVDPKQARHEQQSARNQPHQAA